MISIVIDELDGRLPAGWIARAERALAEVKKETQHENRAKVIDSRQSVWKDLKDLLAELSNGKCWFCECDEIRSDRPVDHFRPKNAVAEDDDHEGYWWLAFDWRNFRYSCDFCNTWHNDKVHGTQGGKGTSFPLWDELRRAKCPTDDLGQEQAMLLDPCCPADPPHLWFEETGAVAAHPRLCPQPGGFSAQRVEKSVRCYHLDHYRVCDRRRTVWQRIRRTVQDAEEQLRRLDKYQDQSARDAVASALQGLRESASRKSPLTATARCALSLLKNEGFIVAEMALMGLD